MAAIEDDLGRGQHLVQFYDGADQLLGVIGRYLGAALTEGDTVILIAVPDHRRAFRSALADLGLDVEAAEAAGRLLLFDAAATVAQFLVDGSVDPEAFDAAVGIPIKRAAAGGPVRIYGEMVSLLWAAGNVTGAMGLERRWNELADTVPFSLFCGYPLELFADGAACEAFGEVCHLHSDVIAAAPAVPGSEAFRRFPPTVHTPRLARRFVGETLAGWNRPHLADDAALVVTELATNAIEHARSDLVVGLSRIDGGLRLVVSDASGDQPTRRPQDNSSLRGRGLQVVDAVTRRWGHAPLGTGKMVWAELTSMPTADRADRTWA